MGTIAKLIPHKIRIIPIILNSYMNKKFSFINEYNVHPKSIKSTKICESPTHSHPSHNGLMGTIVFLVV